MSEFKIGDSVKVVEIDEYDRVLGIKIGSTGVVVDIYKNSSGCVSLVEFNNSNIGRHWMGNYSLKLIKESEK